MSEKDPTQASVEGHVAAGREQLERQLSALREAIQRGTRREVLSVLERLPGREIRSPAGDPFLERCRGLHQRLRITGATAAVSLEATHVLAGWLEAQAC